jgi:hypothetical protein
MPSLRQVTFTRPDNYPLISDILAVIRRGRVVIFPRNVRISFPAEALIVRCEISWMTFALRVYGLMAIKLIPGLFWHAVYAVVDLAGIQKFPHD